MVGAQIINHLHLFLTARESENMSGDKYSLADEFLRIHSFHINAEVGRIGSLTTLTYLIDETI